MATTSGNYDSSAIDVLDGLMPVRVRPGMYIGGTDTAGRHHCLWEVIDNSVDEAMAGQCDRIEVTLNPDGSITVADNGRGIPVDIHPARGVPTVQVVMTILHAGGKFGKEGSGYQYSGGLHGVGISVVNALSDWVKVEIRRDSKIYGISFAYKKEMRDGNEYIEPGALAEELHVIGETSSTDTGTSTTFKLDDDVFDTSNWNLELISERLRNTSFLNKGLMCVLIDNREGQSVKSEWYHPNGVKDFMNELSKERLSQSDHSGKTDLLVPLEPLVLSGVGDYNEGEWEIAFQWFPDESYRLISFANGVSTPNHGAHVDGWRHEITKQFNRYARQDHIQLLSDKDINLEATDVLRGLTVITIVKVRNPQFQGQTKEKLANSEIKSMVRAGFVEQFWDWMAEHPNEAKAIVGKAVSGMRLRKRMEEAAERERNSSEKRGSAPRAQLPPSKLNDCETRDRSAAELFIVEGDSAAGPALMGRDNKTQAILPIRGKILNVLTSNEYQISHNREVQDLINAVGAGSEEQFELSASRYGKVVLLTDADNDGKHIQLLLMTFFCLMMPELVKAGMLWVARPPLFSTVINDQKVYVASDEERRQIEERYPKRQMNWVRFKGLGEMDTEELEETALHPDTRSLVQIVVSDPAEMVNATHRLMGSDSSSKWEELQRSVLSTEEALSA